MTQDSWPPQLYDEVITLGSGVAYGSGGVSLTITKAKQVSACIGAPSDVTTGVTSAYRWQYAPGASGLGAGAQGGQTIQVRAFTPVAASGQPDSEATSTNMSGRQIAVCYRGS